jgi:hypothetical protein
MSDLFEFDAWPFWVCVLGVVVCLGFMVAEAQQWAEFKAEHHCKVVAKVSGDLVPVFGANGSFTVAATPDKKGWLCDDGVTYYR